LQIKLGLIKTFVKALVTESAAFQYLRQMFPNCQNAKLKEGICVGPQIRKIVKDPQFEEKLNHIEKVTHDFLGNKKTENYEEIIKESTRRSKETLSN
jgi:ERCC4-related helicase